MSWQIDRGIYDGVVRQSYERLLLAQPQLEFDGLWFKDQIYYIVCPELTPDTKSKEGMPLEIWFRMHQLMGPLTKIVSEAPAGAERIRSRTAEDLALLRDSSRTFPEIVLAINLALPREFPNFWLEDMGAGCSATFERALSDEEMSIFAAACRTAGSPRLGHTKVDPGADYRSEPFLHVYGPKIGDAGRDLYLTPSRRLSDKVPQKLRWLVEDDEDFWRDQRGRLLTTTTVEQPTEVLPQGWKVPGASCVVDPRAAPTNNIRNYLSIFRQVILVLPTVDLLEAKLQELRLSQRDLIDLVRLGRVSLLLPESIDRYPYAVLQPLAEEVPERLLASRRLAAATIVDTRSRFPLLYPPSGVEERYEILHGLAVVAAQMDNEEHRRFRAAAVRALAQSWERDSLAVHHSGAAVTAMLGMGAFCAELTRATLGEDRWFEFVTAAAGIEWAGALGASIAPVAATEPYTNVVASYYSRVRAEGVPSVQPEVHQVIKSVLVLNDDAPVVPFATAFAGADIDRFRDCVQSLARWNADPDQLEAATDRFNDNVRALERQPHKLAPMDILALAPTVAGIAGVVPGSMAIWITLGMWVMKNLMPFVGNSMAERSKVVGQIFDRTNALLTRSEPDAVLVARMRKQTKT